LARELGRISLAEALELVILIAKKEPRRHPKIAVRWLERYIQECEPKLSDVGLAVSALSALTHEPRAESVKLLRALIGSFRRGPRPASRWSPSFDTASRTTCYQRRPSRERCAVARANVQ
jgi:hypothetical protein